MALDVCLEFGGGSGGGGDFVGLGYPENWEGLDDCWDDSADLNVHLQFATGSGGFDGFVFVVNREQWDDLADLDVMGLGVEVLGVDKLLGWYTGRLESYTYSGDMGGERGTGAGRVV